MLSINKHTNTVDLALSQYQSLEPLFALCIANGASITDDLISGNSWNPVALEIVPERVIVQRIKTIEKQSIKKHQTFVDFVTQASGALDGLFECAKLNGLSITSDVSPGTHLFSVELNDEVLSFFKNKNVDIVGKPLSPQVFPGGIGHMQIGTSFKVY
jgi:hypothetical protein